MGKVSWRPGRTQLVTTALKHQGLLQGRFWSCAHTPHWVFTGTASITHLLSSVNASGAEAKGEKGHDYSEQRSNLSLREREGLTPVYLEAVGAHGDGKSGLLSPWSGSSCLLSYGYSFWPPWVLHRVGVLRLGPPDQGSVGAVGGSLAW